MVNSIATCTMTNLPVAGHAITAYYQGDSECAASQSQVFSQSVTAATTVTTVEIDALPGNQRFVLEVIVTPAFSGGTRPERRPSMSTGGRSARSRWSTACRDQLLEVGHLAQERESRLHQQYGFVPVKREQAGLREWEA